MPNKPKPTVIRILQGNPGKRKLPENEPQHQRELMPSDAPAWLGPDVRAIWERELARAPRGLLGVHHAELFASYCQCLYEIARTGAELAKWQPVIEAGGKNWRQYQISPMHKAFTHHIENARRLAAEFGLTPTTSQKASTRKTDEKTNPFNALKRHA